MNSGADASDKRGNLAGLIDSIDKILQKQFIE